MRLLCHSQARLHHGTARSSCSIPPFLSNPKHTRTHKSQRVSPAEAAVEKEDDERTSQTRIKNRGRSEGRHRLFSNSEVTSLHCFTRM